MKFKGNRVFVEVDDSGGIIAEQNRANMKYRLEDDMVYHPYVNNIAPTDSRAAGSPRPSKPAPKTAPVASGPKADPKKTIIAYTDGACLGNPGPSGAGFLIRYPDGRLVERGDPLGNGTNNIAELTAIMRVLETTEAADADSPIVIYSDSSYSLGVLTKGWKPKANQALIANIKQRLSRFSNVSFKKVKGHAGIPDNERVDELASAAAETQTIIE